MSREIKYIGMDVHKEATVIAVVNGSGKLMMESIVETKASSILQFIHGLRGELHVTWEEGTWAAWLYDLLKPQVQEVLVCDPRRNALLKEGNKSDKIDARKLADLLRTYEKAATDSWAESESQPRDERDSPMSHGGLKRAKLETADTAKRRLKLTGSPLLGKLFNGLLKTPVKSDG